MHFLIQILFYIIIAINLHKQITQSWNVSLYVILILAFYLAHNYESVHGANDKNAVFELLRVISETARPI